MKASVECKENCIILKAGKETEILYDTDLKPWVDSMPAEDFINSVDDYFKDEVDWEYAYKDLKKASLKVYNNLR